LGYSLLKESKKDKDKNTYSNDQGDIQHIQEASDIAQTIKELNDDSVDKTGFSKMDMKSRLNDVEISAILTIDTLSALGFFDEEITFLTLKKERISPSQDGKGRQEVVEIAKGIQQSQSGHSILDGIGNMFRGGNK
jgi:hypothetical protein